MDHYLKLYCNFGTTLPGAEYFNQQILVLDSQAYGNYPANTIGANSGMILCP